MIPVVPTAAAPVIAVTPTVIAIVIAIATMPVAAVPEGAVIAVVVAVAPEAPTMPEGTALAELADLRPAMFSLTAEKAVAVDVALELELLVADALEALVVTIAGLRRGARQQDSAEQHRPTQSRVQ